MSQLADEVRQQLQKGLQDLQTLRDEIRVRLHLASMEAKTRWNEDLEPRLNDLEHQIKDAGERASEAARKAIAEVGEALNHFRASLQDKDKDSST
jgi:phage-related minor tail protein